MGNAADPASRSGIKLRPHLSATRLCQANQLTFLLLFLAAVLRRLKGYNSIVAGYPSKTSDDHAQGSARQPRSTPVLAVDYGRRRIGLAISDAAGWTARPLATIERKGRAADMARLQRIAREHEVRQVIVGHPLQMDGTPGEMANEAARFARRVEQALALPVELVDERLTSWEARQWQAGPGKSRARATDEIAAAILLEEYLGRTPEKSG